MRQATMGIRRPLRHGTALPTLTLAALAALPASATAQANVGVEGTFLIRGGTVVVGTGERLANTDVLLRDGVIAEVGTSISAPGATVIDATDRFVYAGMIDSNTPVGLAEIGGIPQMSPRSELGEFNPHMRAIVAINTGSEMIGITRATGVLSVITSPGGGLVSGQAALINMDGWTWEDMAVKETAGYVLNYPNLSAGGRGRFGGRGFNPGPQALEAVRQQAEEQLDDLKSQIRMARAYEAARRRGLEDVDLVYESMIPLVRGEAPFIVNANSEEQILGALDFAEEAGVRIVINGGRDAWRVRAELAAADVPVVLGRMTSNPPNGLPYDAVYAQPGILVDAGVKIAFSTGGHTNARHVPYEAALATAYGLSLEDAWRAITIWPAEIWGADDVLGTVEEGKMGNVFVATGDPLDIRTTVDHIFIKGRHVPIDDRATRLYEKYNARPMPGGRGR